MTRVTSLRRRMVLSAAVAVGVYSVTCAPSAKGSGILYWDPGHFDTSNGSGPGSWDISNTNTVWQDGTLGDPDVVWNNDGATTATFNAVDGSPPDVVTLNAAINVGGLTFNVAGYDLAAGTGTLTFTSGSNLTQAASVTGTNTIDAATTFAGNNTVNVNGGTLTLTNTSNSVAATSKFVIPTGSTLNANFSGALGSIGAGSITLSGGTLNLKGVGTTTQGLIGQYWQNQNPPSGPGVQGNTFATQYSALNAYFSSLPAPNVTQTLTSAQGGINFTNTGYGNNNAFAGIGVNVGTNNVVARWTGNINLPATLTYPLTMTFGLNSDDASLIYISPTASSQPVVNFNGGHGASANPLDVTDTFTFNAAGSYAIDVPYTQGGGGWGILAEYSVNGTTFYPIGSTDTTDNINFSFTSAAAVTSSNPLNVTANSNLNVISASASTVGPITLSAGTTLTVNASNPVTAGTVTGTGAVGINNTGVGLLNLGALTNGGALTSYTFGGGSTIALTAASTITAPINVTSGTLNASVAGSLGTGAGLITVSNLASLMMPSGATTSNPVIINGDGTASNGALIASSTATWSGPVTIGGVGNGEGFIVSSTAGQTLTLTGGIATGVAANSVRIGGNGNTIISTTGISGAGGVTKTEGGTLTFATGITNSYTGATNINAGTFVSQNAADFTTSSGVAINNSGTLLDIQHAASNLGKVTETNAGAILQLDADQNGGTAPTAGQSGTVNINANQSAGFNLSMTNGSTFESINAARTFGGNVALSGTVNFGGAGQNLTVNGNVTGTGSINKNGGEVITLSGSNSYSGTTTVNSGTFAFTTPLTATTAINVGSATVNAGAAVNSSAPLTIGLGGVYNANVVGSIPNSVTVNYLGTLNHTAAATASGPLAVNGGTVTSSQNVTYSGASTMTAGTIHATAGTMNLGTTLTVTPFQFVNGLVEGHLSGAFDTTDPNPANGNLSTTTFPNGPGNIASGPRVGNVTGNSNSAANGNGFNDNTTYVYTGKVLIPNNNGNGTGSIAFGENFDDSVQIKIDGAVVDTDGSYNTPTEAYLSNLTAGYHTIEIRFGQGGGGVGQNTVNTWGPGQNNLGFGIYYPSSNPVDPATILPVGTATNAVAANGAAFANADPTINLALPPNLYQSTLGGGTLQADSGATITAGQVTGFPNVTLGSTNNATAGTFSLPNQASSTSSQIGNVTITGPSAAGQLAIGTNNIVTAYGINVTGSTLTKTGTGTVIFDSTGAPAGSTSAVLDGTSNLNVNGGIVRINLPLTGNGSINVNAGGTLGGSSTSLAANITVNGGTPGGALLPSAGGTVPTTLTIAGNITVNTPLGPAVPGSLAFGANGTTSDELVITSGTLSFSGSNLVFAPTATPANGTQFTLISDAPGGLSSQQFGTINGATFANPFTVAGDPDKFTISETNTSYVITATTVPEPASLATLAIAGLGLLARRRRRA